MKALFYKYARLSALCAAIGCLLSACSNSDYDAFNFGTGPGDAHGEDHELERGI